MNTVKEGEVLVFPRNDSVADVFVGSGWENHSVFELKGGKPTLVRGAGLPEVQFRFVRKVMVS